MIKLQKKSKNKASIELEKAWLNMIKAGQRYDRAVEAEHKAYQKAKKKSQ
jgi:hypothetical protein